MKRMLKISLLIAILLLLGVNVPTVSADSPALDGVWLKCNAQFKGNTLDTSTGVVTVANISIPVYLHFAWNGIASYNTAVWTKIGDDWTNTFNNLISTVHPGENFISEFALTFQLTSTDFLFTFHTPFIKYKPNTSGNTSKVTYKGTGEVYYGEIGGKRYYGYFNIKGTSVDPSKLPFIP
jgi:hypothetical protein